jgi:superfamily II DNA helicase RecQ
VLKCKLKQITACQYYKEVATTGRHFSVVFSAVEQLRLEELRTYLFFSFLLLVNLSKLHMIFIDETHLVMTTAYYRPDMLYTPTSVELGVPLTLLSATIPEYMQNQFSTIFDVEFATIRACTNRANLKYCVKVSNRLFDGVVETMIVYQERLAHFPSCSRQQAIPQPPDIVSSAIPWPQPCSSWALFWPTHHGTTDHVVRLEVPRSRSTV